MIRIETKSEDLLDPKDLNKLARLSCNRHKTDLLSSLGPGHLQKTQSTGLSQGGGPMVHRWPWSCQGHI